MAEWVAAPSDESLDWPEERHEMNITMLRAGRHNIASWSCSPAGVHRFWSLCSGRYWHIDNISISWMVNRSHSRKRWRSESAEPWPWRVRVP